MNKQIPALVAAFIITVVLGVGMFAIGGNALVSKASAANATTTLNVQADSQAQQVISQYMVREGQYKDQLTQAQDLLNKKQAELDDANNKLDKYRQLVQVLQQVGVITIGGDGSIQINRR